MSPNEEITAEVKQEALDEDPLEPLETLAEKIECIRSNAQDLKGAIPKSKRLAAEAISFCNAILALAAEAETARSHLDVTNEDWERLESEIKELNKKLEEKEEEGSDKESELKAEIKGLEKKFEAVIPDDRLLEFLDQILNQPDAELRNSIEGMIRAIREGAFGKEDWVRVSIRIFR